MAIKHVMTYEYIGSDAVSWKTAEDGVTYIINAMQLHGTSDEEEIVRREVERKTIYNIETEELISETQIKRVIEFSDESAKNLHHDFMSKLSINNLGIIISDTFGRPWRVGQTNISIGSYGINPFINYINKKDAYGEQLNSTNICLVDELAGGAEILMGKTINVPVVVVRGLNFEFSETGSGEILREKDKDLFR